MAQIEERKKKTGGLDGLQTWPHWGIWTNTPRIMKWCHASITSAQGRIHSEASSVDEKDIQKFDQHTLEVSGTHHEEEF